MADASPARLSCRAGIARAGVSRAGAVLRASDALPPSISGGVADANDWTRTRVEPSSEPTNSWTTGGVH